MHSYQATVHWKLDDQSFTENKYSRKHSWTFDGGLTVPASASPQVVPAPLTDSSAIDPEEAFVASLSSCHMLWFLSIASKKGYLVEDYKDQANGFMEQNKEGKWAITQVILNPDVHFGNKYRPKRVVFDQIHRQAHQECFIAHSVKTEITINANLQGIS